MRTGGQWVVLGMLAIALSASLGAWLWNLNHSQRALAFWGPRASQLVLKAPRVELLRLALETDGNPVAEMGETLHVGDDPYRVIARKDLSQAPGLIHARHSLTDDASFLRLVAQDGANPERRGGAWTHALRFAETAGEPATVLLDFEKRKVRLLESAREAEVSQRFVEGWRDFCRRQLGE